MSPGLEAAYDPIAMGGDGLIATSSPFPAPDMPTTARAETSPYTQVGEVDAVDSGAVTPGIGAGAGVARSRSVRSVRRRQRFIRCLERDSVDLAELRKLAWGGVPNELRPMVWQLLLVSPLLALGAQVCLFRCVLTDRTRTRILTGLPSSSIISACADTSSETGRVRFRRTTGFRKGYRRSGSSYLASDPHRCATYQPGHQIMAARGNATGESVLCARVLDVAC